MTIHATEHGRHQGWVDKHPQSYIHGVERWITNRADRVIACSFYMREQIADIFGVDEVRVTVIPNGIDPDDLRPHDEPELRRLRAEFAAPEEKLVLLIGRLVEKGFQLALEAMPMVLDEAPDTRFLVAASGTHEPELKRQAAELGLLEHGSFSVGSVTTSCTRCTGSRTSAWCRRSTSQFGLVALESMASGCPASWPTQVASARSFPRTAPGFASARGTRRRSPRWRFACCATKRLASAWWPRASSTSAASTGPTWPGRRPSSRRARRRHVIAVEREVQLARLRQVAERCRTRPATRQRNAWMGGIAMPRSTCLVAVLAADLEPDRRVAVDQPALRRPRSPRPGSIPARRPRAVTPILGSGSAGRARMRSRAACRAGGRGRSGGSGDRRGAGEREGEAADDGGHRQDREEPHADLPGVHELDAAHPGGLRVARPRGQAARIRPA